MRTIIIAILLAFNLFAQAQTEDFILDKNWKFTKGNMEGAEHPGFDDSNWESVSVPHDWAIFGPFDKEVDKQVVAITQNNEQDASEKTGRTGSLPHIGDGWYRTSFELPKLAEDSRVLVLFEGAMSDPVVFVNGQKAGEWGYGYAYFKLDITDLVKSGNSNLLAVHLSPKELSSRWYPGAGLFRKVRVLVQPKNHFQLWNTFVTSPYVSDSLAQINVKTKVEGKGLRLETEIKDASGKVLASASSETLFGDEFVQNIALENPKLWSPESPTLYVAESKLYDKNGALQDVQTTRFGVRTISYTAGEGFKLNGKITKFRGVCLHHDLGPLGAAVNKAALRRQIQLMKDMGANAIRSSHNMPSMEQLELCDEMGMLFLAESFDEWKKPKVKNGYNRFFDDYHEKDIVNLVRATRNHPCIVLWSSGNEVPDQWGSEGVKRAKRLQEIFHREDPTRPVTVGMDQVKAVMESGFGAIMDVPGLNYRTHLYEEAYDRFPQGFVLGSETASTVSSRGIYKFPVEKAVGKMYPDGQSSSYDLEYCNWSNLPEDDAVLQDDKDWVIGEFVWTGFDYLGEPTPYDEYWPSRSSYFGICDLAGLPKDRYYWYKSRWNTDESTLHILPHWNWPGMEGDTVPVFVYTSYNSAELFVNGKSMGVRTKNKESKLERYRLMWNDVVYEPGELKVVAYDDKGTVAVEEVVRTAGKPYRLVLEPDRKTISADGQDISFVTVSVVDKNGVPCPTVTNQLDFKVDGAGNYRAACNGDATSLELFHLPTMKLFSGKLVVLVQSTEQAGDISLQVKGKGLKAGKLTIQSK
ncbi:glycoside hydrolase family 2 TIM barrel-domain containing protein [Mangrovibacterium sp.]|uniref:glycoside hydrolase family 2 TIM barrel-domain containing protein n=1 Tax=Mangrovibacterium sp. TaxID=1961364 RepID=UPI0035649D48